MYFFHVELGFRLLSYEKSRTIEGGCDTGGHGFLGMGFNTCTM